MAGFFSIRTVDEPIELNEDDDEIQIDSLIPSAISLQSLQQQQPSQNQSSPLEQLKFKYPSPSSSSFAKVIAASTPSESENKVLDFHRPLNERISYFLDNDLGTDVEFIVGKDEVKIKGHKMMLASASPVFFSMFFSKMDSESNVKVPDCDSESFKALIHFIYKGEASLSTIGQKSLETLYVARKYDVGQLENYCNVYLLRTINKDSVFKILEIGDMYDLQELSNACNEFIETQTSEVLETHILTIGLDVLIQILQCDILSTDEVELFNFVMKWAKNECEKKGLEESPDNIRALAAPAISLIRFPTMRSDEIANFVVPTKILTHEQIANIYTHMFTRDEEKADIEFNSTRRRRGEKNMKYIFVSSNSTDSSDLVLGFGTRLRATRRARRRSRRIPNM